MAVMAALLFWCCVSWPKLSNLDFVHRMHSSDRSILESVQMMTANDPVWDPDHVCCLLTECFYIFYRKCNQNHFQNMNQLIRAPVLCTEAASSQQRSGSLPTCGQLLHLSYLTSCHVSQAVLTNRAIKGKKRQL